MSLRWYAITSKVKTRDKFLKEIKKSPSSSKLKEIKDVILYDFKREDIDLESDDSLLSGYCLIQINDKVLKDVVSIIESSKLGKFISFRKDGTPFPIPQEEVRRFQKGVKTKIHKFRVGEQIRIVDGILKGFEGTILKISKLMVVVEVNLPNSVISRSINITCLEKKGKILK